MHLSLLLFDFKHRKDKYASYLFTTKKSTHSMCQVSLVVKYIFLYSTNAISTCDNIFTVPPSLASPYIYTGLHEPLLLDSVILNFH